ncbi:UNVERIFIED_CONTAM: hypothetical protein Scaly_0256300 [Sesamum calycinum]|uniref:Uncharacterized protein n=1 Tax=Sesamum calycinum TaxID=2727403 RepID=A0AAW2S9K0_9LAMI
MPKSKRKTRIDLGIHCEQKLEKVVDNIGKLQIEASTSLSHQDDTCCPPASGRSPYHLLLEIQGFAKLLMNMERGREGHHSRKLKIVNRCREMGCGPGGFYRPGYDDRAKLRLYIMCLGVDRNPQTRKYRERRHDHVAPLEQKLRKLAPNIFKDVKKFWTKIKKQVAMHEEGAKVKKFENKVEWGIGLASEHERLVQNAGEYVVTFPRAHHSDVEAIEWLENNYYGSQDTQQLILLRARSICQQWLLDHCYDDMEFRTKFIDKTDLQRLEVVAKSKFHRIPYTTLAVAILFEGAKVGELIGGSQREENYEVFKQRLLQNAGEYVVTSQELITRDDMNCSEAYVSSGCLTIAMMIWSS